MKSPNGSRWRLTIDDSGSLIRTIITLVFLLSFMCGSQAQTVRDLVYGTNNVVVGPTNTNALSFTNSVAFSNPLTFGTNAPTTRTNLGIGWSALTNTSATNFRTDLGFSTNLSSLWTATNPAQGRTAIGISSASKRTATAFAAEFYDDFSAYADGTLVTNDFSPIYGPNYSLIYYAATNASPLAPSVTNGMLRPSGTNNPPDGNETYYLTSVLPSNVRSFGADVRWVTNANINYSSIVFLIRTNNDFLGSFLHIPVSFTNTSLQWSTNGAGGLTTVTSVGYTNLVRGQTVRILGSIRSNVLTMNVGGNIIKATNSFFETLAGRWFTFEQYGYGLYGITDLAEVERVWANAAWQDAMTPNGTWDIYNPAGLRTNLGVTVASNLPAPWSGSATTNSLLVANGSGSSVFVSTLPSLTLATGTITNSNPALSISQTWSNTNVAFTGLLVNITNTGSSNTSTLADFQVAGSTRQLTYAAGDLVTEFGSVSAGRSHQILLWGNGTGRSHYIKGSTTLGLVFNYGTAGSHAAIISASSQVIGFRNRADGGISWTSDSNNADSGTADLLLIRDAANTLASRNGTNAQTYNVYGSYTNSTNYRRLSLGMSNSGIAFIRPEQAGPLTNASNFIYISGLPTNSAGLPSGVLWNSNGSVVVSP